MIRTLFLARRTGSIRIAMDGLRGCRPPAQVWTWPTSHFVSPDFPVRPNIAEMPQSPGKGKGLSRLGPGRLHREGSSARSAELTGNATAWVEKLVRPTGIEMPWDIFNKIAAARVAWSMPATRPPPFGYLISPCAPRCMRRADALTSASALITYSTRSELYSL